jgi:hypothetical protein
LLSFETAPQLTKVLHLVWVKNSRFFFVMHAC